MDQDTLVIENASSVMLLTRIEHFANYGDDKVEALRQAVEQITPDYAALLERHRKVQSEMLNRVTVDFGGATQYGMSAEELLADQRSRPDYSPALLERLFEMGRHWFILTSGKYPNIPAEVDFTINLQTAGLEPADLRRGEETRPAGPGLLQMAGAVQGDLREGVEAYFDWIESLAPDCRANAKNIFGFRGTSYPLWPQKGMGVKYYYSGSAIGGFWPFWISAGGLAYRPFWDHYLATGDVNFLRKRVVPGLKELALFYEDFLTSTDKNGNYIFAPSFSPENNPASTDPSGPVLVNAAIDIAVCREVLSNLIQACETLGIEADSVPKWKAMLARMPPYLLERDGTLKEWAWPTLQERYAHRHVSHLYGAWPGDEIDPDRTPQLATGRGDRRPEAHFRCDVHRGLGRNFGCLCPLPSGFGRCAAQRQRHRGRPTAATARAGLRQRRAPVFARAVWRAGAGCARRNSRDHHGNAGLLASRDNRGVTRTSSLPGEGIDQRDAGPHFRADRQISLGHGNPDRGRDDHLGEKARHHVDCPAWDRTDHRTRRRSGGEAQIGRGRLRPALAGGKTGGDPFKARSARSA